MTTVLADKLNRDGKKRAAAAVLQYTLIFCALILGIFGVLIISHRSFIQNGDGVKQGYFWTLELKRQLQSIMAGDGLSLWSWSKGTGMDVRMSFFFDPFNCIAAAFPDGYIELGYTFAIVLKLYCGGLAFLAFALDQGLGVYESVTGSVFYTFSGHFIVLSLIHGDALTYIYIFPLLIMAADRIYRGKSPLLFSLLVAFYVFRDFYYAYMAGIAIVIFILVRYFAYGGSGIREFFSRIGSFIFWGAAGLCLAGVGLVKDITELFGASSDSGTDTGAMLFDTEYYVSIGRKLIGTGNTSTYHIVGLSAIALILTAAAVTGINRRRTELIMTGLFSAGLLLPQVCSILNGFGYPTIRWVFILVFFASWTAAAQLGSADLLKKDHIAAGAAAFCALAVWSTGLPALGLADIRLRAVLFMCVQLAGGFVFLSVLFLRRKEGSLRRIDRAVILITAAAVLTVCWTGAFYDSRTNFRRNNSINKDLYSSVQRVGAQIDDGDFYRIDQVDSSLYSHVMKSPPNESLWWKTRPIYIYNSRIPQKLLEFNGIMGNSYGYSKRVYMLSNDNRTGLDYLYGVRYFLGNDSRYGRSGSDEYAGYAFEPYTEIDGVNVFRSRFRGSLGYVFDKYMTESEFLKLGKAEREQALLQAAVVPDGTALSAEKVTAQDIDTAVGKVSYEIVKTDGITFGDGTIRADKKGASFTIRIGDVKNSQVLLSISGLMRDPEDGQSKSFIMTAQNSSVMEMADNEKTNQSIPSVRDYDLNMGYYSEYDAGDIKVTLSKKGTYDYDSINVFAMDAGLFDKYISEREQSRYIIDDFSDEEVNGKVTAPSQGILFLSMPSHDNWDIYIDGEKADRIEDVDIAFFGAEIPAGTHSVQLVYNNRKLKAGMLISLAGICLLAAGLIRRKNRGRAGQR